MEDTHHVTTGHASQTLFEGVIARLESLAERQGILSKKIYEKTLLLGDVCTGIGDEKEKKTPNRNTVVGNIVFLMDDLERGIGLLETSLDNLERTV